MRKTHHVIQSLQFDPSLRRFVERECDGAPLRVAPRQPRFLPLQIHVQVYIRAQTIGVTGHIHVCISMIMLI